MISVEEKLIKIAVLEDEIKAAKTMIGERVYDNCKQGQELGFDIAELVQIIDDKNQQILEYQNTINQETEEPVPAVEDAFALVAEELAAQAAAEEAAAQKAAEEAAAQKAAEEAAAQKAAEEAAAQRAAEEAAMAAQAAAQAAAAQAAAAQAAAAQPTRSVIYCSRCGKENAANYKFCCKCGAQLING